MNITIRTRLTLLFAGLFVVLAAVLVTTSYLFVANATTPAAQSELREDALREALLEQGFEVPPRAEPGHAGQPGQGPGSQGQPRPRTALTDTIEQLQEQARQNVLQDLLSRSLIAFALSAIIAIALAYWLAGRVLRPIDEISRAANSLSESTLDKRITNDGPNDEFGRLKTAFNGMLGRLETAFMARQRFAADASHELRTPLAVMRAAADNALATPRPARQSRELAEEVQRQVERSDSLITSLLALARADDVAHTREAIDLADTAASVVSESSARATAAGVTLELELADAPLLGDRVLIERMVANVVDNAIRYNAPIDGWALCRVWSESDHAILEVVNAGAAVDPAEVASFFERFRRGAQRWDVAGHGLGLAIVTRVADVHGGTAEALPRAEGGLVVRISLPSYGSPKGEV